MRKGIKMVAGVPGAGVGGMFYLVCAFVMPVKEIVLTLLGKSNVSRWKVVWLHFCLASGILGSLWLTGCFLGFCLRESINHSNSKSIIKIYNVFHIESMMVTFFVLISVLLTIDIVSLLFKTLTSKRKV